MCVGTFSKNNNLCMKNSYKLTKLVLLEFNFEMQFT